MGVGLYIGFGRDGGAASEGDAGDAGVSLALGIHESTFPLTCCTTLLSVTPRRTKTKNKMKTLDASTKDETRRLGMVESLGQPNETRLRSRSYEAAVFEIVIRSKLLQNGSLKGRVSDCGQSFFFFKKNDLLLKTLTSGGTICAVWRTKKKLKKTRDRQNEDSSAEFCTALKSLICSVALIDTEEDCNQKSTNM